MATEVALAVEVVSQDRQVVRWAAAVAMAELKAVELKAVESGVVAMMAMEAAVVVALAEAVLVARAVAARTARVVETVEVKPGAERVEEVMGGRMAEVVRGSG